MENKLEDRWELCKKVGRRIVDQTRIFLARLGNLCKRARDDGGLAYWQTKQIDAFAKLGQKVFELLPTHKENIFEQDEIKQLVKEVEDCVSHIQRIKDEIDLQKRKMDRLAILGVAKKGLKSKDPKSRRAAIRMLEKVDDKGVIPLLMDALGDPDEQIRSRAADLLHRLVDSLKLGATKSSQPEVKEEVRKAQSGETLQKQAGSDNSKAKGKRRTVKRTESEGPEGRIAPEKA